MGEWTPVPQHDDLSPDCADRRHDWCAALDCCCGCHIPDYQHPEDDDDG